uniref:Uncharacterized protein n=1 Tax=Arundo donax TaxID=35708 RepID=A0A0A9DNX1_ARUDO
MRDLTSMSIGQHWLLFSSQWRAWRHSVTQVRFMLLQRRWGSYLTLMSSMGLSTRTGSVTASMMQIGCLKSVVLMT